MPPYDVLVSPRVRQRVDRLSLRQQVLFQQGVAQLLDDPTTQNMFVVEMDGIPPFGPGDYGLVWGELSLVFHFVTPLVVEILGLLTPPP